jgi:excinuclease ABC subunit C
MIIALAKKEETLFSPYLDAPLNLPQNHPVLRFVTRIRDEAHRWVITYHRTVRGKQFRASSLETVPGIGKQRAAALLRHFGSLARLREASISEISAVTGFSATSAANLLKHLPAQARAARPDEPDEHRSTR